VNDLIAAYPDHLARLADGYARALTAHGWDAVVIHSGVARKRVDVDDQYWPVRPTPHLQHWAPLAEPDAFLVVRAGHRPTLLRVTRFDFWEHAFAPESDHFVAHFDPVSLDDAGAAKHHLPTGRVAFIGDDRARAAALGFADDAVNPSALVAALDALRTLKTPYEVACLAEANRRAALGHDAVLAAFRDGDDIELDLHLAYLRATRQDDPETPYKNIVALGRNAATLHHVSYGRRPAGAGALLLDAGATCMGYCSDITRTWVRGHGAAADTFRALVAGVEAMQRRLCAAVREGDPYEALHDRSHREVGDILRDVGVLKTSGDEAVAKDVTRAFYPHGLGHSLGLQCHDVGCALVKPRADNPFLRNTSVIAQGQTFTIEPGVYFIDGLLAPLREGAHGSDVDWRLVDALAPFGGVRIEDDVVVNGSGPGAIRNLTREHLPLGGGSV
jgi:Xaa-Pro dipeptidase